MSGGTKIYGPLVSADPADKYYHADAKKIKGGHQIVNTIEQRDLIDNEIRKEGMTCDVIEEDTNYILIGGISNSNWEIQSQGRISLSQSIATLGFLKAFKSNITSLPSLNPDNLPLFVYSINNNSGASGNTALVRNVVNCIYLDGLFNGKLDVTLNKRARFPINPKLSGNQTIPITSSTFAVSNRTVNNLVTNLSSINTKQKYLAVGDSITAQDVYDDINNSKEYWNYTSKIQSNALKDNIDNSSVPSILTIGHLNFQSRNFTYKGNNLTLRSGNGGQSGWTGSQYLNHAIQLSGIDVGSGLDRTIYGRPIPEIGYYILGLVANGGGAWTGSNAQIELIRTTLQGKYSCDKNATLFNFLKAQVDWIGDTGTYTGSTTQNDQMDAYLEAILDNPRNPFYSKTKARTGGATNAFSLSTYLSRYKTLADDGTTRLIVGVTAGTKVTNATAYDVCTPTHVSFNFGENDLWLFPNATFDQIATTVRTLANSVIGEYPSMKVAIFTNPHGGTNYPELFEEGVRFPKLDVNNTKSGLRNAIISNLGVTASTVKTGNIYYIDTYLTTYPLSRSLDNFGESNGEAIDYENLDQSGVHLGLKGYASMGDHVQGWIYYSVNN